MKTFTPGQTVKIDAADLPGVTEGTYVARDSEFGGHKDTLKLELALAEAWL